MRTTAQAERTTEPCRWPTIESVEENLRQARRVVNTARHAAEGAAGEAELNIRRYPLQAVGAAIVVGVVVGSAFGFGVGWFARTRRSAHGG
jgi:ElaB/YqjD/DUF883 family membrane-anchored ribosome-binding protein